MPQLNTELATETSSKASPTPPRPPAFTPRRRKTPRQIRELENSTSPSGFSAASKTPSRAFLPPRTHPTWSPDAPAVPQTPAPYRHSSNRAASFNTLRWVSVSPSMAMAAPSWVLGTRRAAAPFFSPLRCFGVFLGLRKPLFKDEGLHHQRPSAVLPSAMGELDWGWSQKERERGSVAGCKWEKC